MMSSKLEPCCGITNGSQTCPEEDEETLRTVSSKQTNRADSIDDGPIVVSGERTHLVWCARV